MLYLLLAIVCASTYSVLFKLFACRDVDSLQAIAFNYLTATLLGVGLSLGDLEGGVVLTPREWGLSVVMGVMFMAAFVLMARSTAISGVSVTTVAARVSLIIPVVCSYLFLPNQVEPRWVAIGVIILALVMVIWTPSKGDRKEQRRGPGGVLLPLGVFLLFGANNFCLKWAQSGLEAEAATSQLSAAIFLFAALSSGGYYFAATRKRSFSLQALVGGVLLGVANFFTTYFMLLGLGLLPSGVFFPIYHIGIVALVTTCGVALFRERLGVMQVVGLVVAAAGIVAFFV
jgi:drug/metabolite transporter (DMT)-like permease